MSGGEPLSTSETKIEALSLQSSAYGVTLPVVYGVNRIAGNLIWYGGFKATPHTTSQSTGKGGSVKAQNTTYTYSASLMMGLCEGQISGVTRIWKGKQLYSGGLTPAQLGSAFEDYTVPGGGGTFTCANSATFAANISVIGRTGWNVDTYTWVVLAEGTDYTRVGGVYTFSGTWAGLQVTVTYQYVTGGGSQTALQALGLSFAAGALGQVAWSFLSTFTPATPPGGAAGSQSLGYSGLAYVYAQDYQLGTAATVDNHTFEVQGPQAYSVSQTIPDANPATLTQDLLGNGRYGAAFPSAQLGPITTWSNYCLASGLLLSPALEEQMRAADFVTLIGKITNTAPVWSGGKLLMIPYGDVSLAGNGATYTPNVTPVYDLTDDDFLGSGDPVKVKRKPQADAYNHIRVEFCNRANLYNVEVAEAKDSANIDAFGLRSAPILKAHWICDAAVAGTAAQLTLQRSMYVRNTYQFTLPWTKALLDLMDLVTLTDAGLQFNKLPVRITDIDENEDGDLAVEAEEFALGIANVSLHPRQLAAGYQHDYNADPGDVATPVFCEAPIERTVTGLEVYAAVRGMSALWGGCRVWASLDGNNYKEVATVYGGARYGALSGAITGDALPVTTSGQLISGSATDATALTTLCWVGGAAPEYLAYTTATLTGPGAYTLSGLVRGAYGSSQASEHAINDAFVRIDDAIAKSGPLELTLIGQTVHFKFTSFNLYIAAEQSLADVEPYSYTITGNMVALPPSPPTGLAYAFEPFGIRLTCNKNPEPDVVGYEWRAGPTWGSAQVLDKLGGTSYLWVVQTQGSFTVWVAAVDALGNSSTPASITGAAPVHIPAPLVTMEVRGSDYLLSWSAIEPGFGLDAYEVRTGPTLAESVVLDRINALSRMGPIDWAGTKTFWVAAVDRAGNVGAHGSASFEVPGMPAPLVTFAVRGGDYLLSWSAVEPVLGLDAYEVRAGPTLATSVVLDRINALSRMGPIDWAGTKTFWVAAVDRAGNVGAYGSALFAVPGPDAGTVSIDVAGNAVIAFTTYTDPQIVGYEIRTGATWETGVVVATTQGRTFSVPLLTAAGKTYWVKGMYEAGGYTLTATRTAFLGDQLAMPSALSWRVSEPDLVFTWDLVVGAAQYLVLFEDGGVTSTTVTTLAQAAFHIPKYAAALRVIAIASNGNLSAFADLNITVTGRYNMNEILSVPLPITTGKYLNLAFTVSNTIKRAGLRGINPVAPYAQNINDGDLFAFGYNLAALPVSNVQAVVSKWFRNGFWRESEGMFESAVVDLGAIYSGRLSLLLTKAVDFVGDAPVSAYNYVACEYLDPTTAKELVDTKAFVAVRFQVATDNTLSSTWIDADNGDWVTARYVRLLVQVAMASPLTEITITAGTITIDVPDITESGSKTGVTSAGAAVAFTRSFTVVSAVLATARGAAKAYTSGISPAGCTLYVDTGTQQVDYFVKGY